MAGREASEMKKEGAECYEEIKASEGHKLCVNRGVRTCLGIGGRGGAGLSLGW